MALLPAWCLGDCNHYRAPILRFPQFRGIARHQPGGVETFRESEIVHYSGRTAGITRWLGETIGYLVWFSERRAYPGVGVGSSGRIYPTLHNFFEYTRQTVFKFPGGEMISDLRKVRNVADMIADSVPVVISVVQLVSHIAEQPDSFKDRQTIPTAAA